MTEADSKSGLSVPSTLVEELTSEVSGLREALRQRAVVEQATGLLAGRLSCGLSTAFQHLSRIAQDTDTTVNEAAYLLLSEISPADFSGPPPAPGPMAAASGGAEVVTILSKEAVLRKAAEAPRRVAPVISEPAESPLQVQLIEVAELIPLPAFVLSPVSDADGEITDFRIDYANGDGRYVHGRDGTPVIGQTLLSVFPEMTTSGLFNSYAHAMRGGRALKLDLFPFQGMVNGVYVIRTVDIRAQRYGDQLLVTWRVHDTTSERARRIADAERLGHIGWGEWNLYSDEVTWSYELYGMHGRDLADGPLPLDSYRDVVHPDDLPVIEGLLRGLTERGEDTEVEFRIQVPDGETKHIRISATTISDPDGKLLLLRGVFQDMTDRRKTEHELHAARATVERARRDATLRIQRALLPDENTRVNTRDYELAVRYISAEPGNKAGGDWYETRVRPDGSIFIAVGDVAGHGLEAAASMARINNALRGLSASGLDCADMLGALNQLVCETEDEETVASAITGTLEPGQRVLHWAQAGHPPPVLIRDSVPLLLDRPRGLMLGTAPNATYRKTSTELHHGDLLLWYTDGLIEHRRRDIDAGISRLLDAASGCTLTSAEAFLADLPQRLGPLTAGDDICMLAALVR